MAEAEKQNLKVTVTFNIEVLTKVAEKPEQIAANVESVTGELSFEETEKYNTVAEGFDATYETVEVISAGSKSIVERAKLATEVYKKVLQAVESLEQPDLVGPDLAYLLGAILCLDDNGRRLMCSWVRSRPIVGILRQEFPEDNDVWYHVDIMPDDNNDG